MKSQSYSLPDLENHFLQNNYWLIAEKLNVNRADAEILQEKLWPNPTLNVSEVNLWSGRNSEQFPALIGKYGKTQQISVGLEQLIVTAGKRKKRVQIKSLEKKSVDFEYQELILNLKKELRNSFYEIQNTNSQITELEIQLDLFSDLENQYRRQSQLKNVSLSEYLRIKTEVRTLQNELILLRKEESENLVDLETLTQIPFLTTEKLHFEVDNYDRSQQLPANLTDLYQSFNPTYLNQLNNSLIAGKTLELARAERTPDITLQVDYDRGGNIMQDFVGIGFSVDLPLFNTNKGNIKASQFAVESQEYENNATKWELQTKISQNVRLLQNYESNLKKWSESDNTVEDEMILNYRKQLQTKQVTLLELLDFMEAVRNSKKALYDLRENYTKSYEEIQYLTGKDL